MRRWLLPEHIEDVLPAEARSMERLRRSILDLFERRDDVYLLGEDVLDPYGGAFKITQGLSSRWPKRVITTPVSEAGLFGVAAGMAMRGYRPILEIMFGDFIALGFDQIVNGIGKFREMFDDQVRVPMVVRTPMGGRRGYGPTHSQSLEKLLLGVPGITVVAPSDATRSAFAVPQTPVTSAPRCRASCTAEVPTAPEAPKMRTRCPDRTSAVRRTWSAGRPP